MAVPPLPGWEPVAKLRDGHVPAWSGMVRHSPAGPACPGVVLHFPVWSRAVLCILCNLLGLSGSLFTMPAASVQSIGLGLLFEISLLLTSL